MSVRSGLAALAAVALLSSACSPTVSTDSGTWPQWRGPSGLGVSAEVNLPEVWSADSPNVRWKTLIPGSGNSSPIVSGGRLFLTTTYGKPTDRPQRAKKRKQIQFVVVALDASTGEILWQTPVSTGPSTKLHWLNTLAAPTPVTDGERIFAYFGPVLAALDRDGVLLWSQEVDPDYAKYAHYGVASSPILTDRGVVVMQDKEEAETEDPGWIALYDKESGELIWRDEWMHTCCSYTTPLLIEREGKTSLVNSSAMEVIGYDPETGDRWWKARHRSIQPVPSMVTDGELLFAPGGIHERATTAMRLIGAGDKTTTEELWETPKGAPDMASPVLYRGWLFRVTESGILTAADPETGKIGWRERLSPGLYRISLVAGDGKIYATNNYGTTSVVAVDGEKPEVVAVNELGDGGNASPALGGGCFLHRSTSQLYCVEKG